ncbi:MULTISPECIES: ATP-binding protein [unclassified Anaeromyxobacter]|uniref:ATP-binding protein n=1 Tax=unclassified Anaeromyxobacter TaxID=2620896 RepID=UPI001F588881|nr:MULTISPECIES: ATP-binding protein [unclassified Anaeromyxobacter]
MDDAVLREVFRTAAVPAVVLEDGVVKLANEAFARALGQDADALRGAALGALLPPVDGEVPTPLPGTIRSYRTSVAGVPARVDVSAALTPAQSGAVLGSAALALALPDEDTAVPRVLLALSRELAEARSEDQITAAVARALELLFPARSFCVRLVDPRTFALTTLYARGRLRPLARGRLALKAIAVERTGLSRAALEQGGVQIVERDVPLFAGCDEASAVPLAVAGQLFGIVNLEYARGGPGDPLSDASLLYQVANHAALGVRNLRSVEELTYLKTYLEDLIEHANALIFVASRAREVIVWNAALVRLTGVAREEALGGDLLARIPPEEHAAVEAVLARGLSGESVDGFETRLLAAGREARIAVNTAPIFGAAGDVEGVIAIGHDLTRVRSLEAAAEHAERLAGIGRLVAGVVHELNNPLTAVNMYSDVLVEKLQNAGHDPADVEKLRAIREGGQRIQRLARDLVAYAKPSGARAELVDLASVLDEAARLAKPALKEMSAVLEQRLVPVPPVEGNRPSLVHVFVNLVRNAAQAVGEGGRVSLALEQDGETVKVAVQDDGAGMPPEIAARAFEPFFTTRPGVGIGLGLPIVQGILERHGGRIALDTAEGRGTTVTVTLPVRGASAER